MPRNCLIAIAQNAAGAPENALPQELALFEQLPDSAHVSVKIVSALYDCSEATVWRRTRQGDIAAPRRFGKRTTRWSVGDLRADIARAKEKQ